MDINKPNMNSRNAVPLLFSAFGFCAVTIVIGMGYPATPESWGPFRALAIFN